MLIIAGILIELIGILVLSFTRSNTVLQPGIAIVGIIITLFLLGTVVIKSGNPK